jgi:hypothetical protein
VVLSVSPALTGSPTAPTQSAGDNSAKIATTGYVATAVSNSAKQVIYANGALQTVAAGSVVYAGLGGLNATESFKQIVIPFSGTVKNLYVVTTTSQPGDASAFFTVRKNGTSTSLTLTVPAGGAAGTRSELQAGTWFTVAAGDLLTVHIYNASVSASATVGAVSFEIDPG